MTKAIASMAIAMATETGQVDLMARLSQEWIIRRAISFGQWQMCRQDCSEVVQFRAYSSEPPQGNRMNANNINSFPFKGEVGWGWGWGCIDCIAATDSSLFPHPHPSPPLEGEGESVHAIALRAAPKLIIWNDLEVCPDGGRRE